MKHIKQFVPALCVLLFGYLTGRSQSLVANGSFEDVNLCTEFHKYCAPEAWVATSGQASYYFGDLSIAYEGYHYVGLTAGNVNKRGVRNFIRTRLLCGLRKGYQYNIDFYVTASNKVLDSIGVYFSTDDFLYEKRNFKEIQPVYWYTRSGSNAAPDNRKWQKVHFVYTATGNENFIVIGLFKRNDYTGNIKPDFQDDYFFLLDKVSLTPADPNEKICSDAERQKWEIYKEDDRHKRLDEQIAYYQKNPPPRLKLALTRIPFVRHVDTLIVPDIFFEKASFELSKKSFALLDSFSRQLTGQMDSIIVNGHTDSVGNLEYNKELSLNRAVSVKQYLMTKVASLNVNFIARGYAYLQPIASNRSPSGRKRNRRVEIFVYRRD
jgi:outer membrane protein OmpA-like peptidoglycan-associated protein